MKFSKKQLKEYIITKFELEMLKKINLKKENLQDYITNSIILNLKLKNL